MLYFVQQQVVQSHTTHIPQPAHIYVALVISNVLLLWRRESSACAYCQSLSLSSPPLPTVQIMDLLHLSGGKFVENMADLRKDYRVFRCIQMYETAIMESRADTLVNICLCPQVLTRVSSARCFVVPP